MRRRARPSASAPASNDYLPVVLTRWEGVEVLNYSPLIYANGADNIAITGSGTFDGQGEAWFPMRPWQKADRERLWNSEADGIPVEERIYGTVEGALRPAMVQPFNCTNVLIEGPTFTRSPFWVIHPVYCDRLIIRNVKVDSHGVNNDAVDLDSCTNSLVERCDFTVGDDAVAIKSGRDADGWRVGRPSENIIVRHITSTNGHGGCVIGSELSGGARNIIFHDIYFKNTITAIRIKSKIGRGGVIEDIWFKDIVVTDLKQRPCILARRALRLAFCTARNIDTLTKVPQHPRREPIELGRRAVGRDRRLRRAAGGEHQPRNTSL